MTGQKKQGMQNRIFAAIFGLMLCCGVLLAVSDTVSAAAAASGVNVEYHTQQEISDYIHYTGKAKPDDALTFAVSPQTTAPFALGELSQETLDSAINMLNQIRYIAGISHDVVLSDEYNQLTQAAALCNYINDDLTHYPSQPAGMDDSMFALASRGAGSSNIAWASWADYTLNEAQVYSWMEDGDAYNIDRVGHRRWMLNPSMGATGFGSVSGENGTYSAIYAFDMSNSAADEYGVMWPAQNMPIQYFSTAFPWSVSMGQNVDAGSVAVRLVRQRDGAEWNFSSAAADGYFNVNNDGYGQTGCIIFRPDASTVGKYEAGDIFDVTITGTPGGDVSYAVEFFDYHHYVDVLTKATAANDGSIVQQCSACDETAGSETIYSIDSVTLSKTEYTYNGTEQRPGVTVKDRKGEVIDPSFYTVTYPVSSIEPGEYSVKILFNGLYEGEISRTYSIEAEPVAAKDAATAMSGIKVLVDTKANGTSSVSKVDASNKKTVVISASVTIDYASYDVTAVDGNAFSKCKKTTKIVLPKTIKLIKKNAFYGAKKLKTIQYKGTKSITIKKGAFKGLNTAKMKFIVSEDMKSKEFNKIKKALKRAGFKGTIKKA